jgi:Fe-Mn family superoxide dismutase
MNKMKKQVNIYYMTISLSQLPYEPSALTPYISESTIGFHYGKHHNNYVINLNKLVIGTEFENMNLEDIVKASSIDNKYTGIFNNSAQVWNHDFFWKSMSPDGGYESMSDQMKVLIEKSFGSYDDFETKFKSIASSQFGSGWVWIVKNNDTHLIEIMSTSNALTPLTNNKLTTLITLDVWEHSYYLDYQNRRVDYIDVFLKNLINWSFAEKNYKL